MEKRRNCGFYPLFYLIRHAVEKVDGSRMEGWLQNGSYIRNQPLYKAMLELAARYVRIYKPIAAHIGELEDQISARFNTVGGSYMFHKAMPNRFSAIGNLTVEDGEIVATSINTDVSFSAVRYRDKELEKLKKKRFQLTGKLLDVWILQKETEEVIRLMKFKNRETERTERIKNAYERRSEAAKQAWIRRQQSINPDQQRGSCTASRKDHGECY